MIRRTLRAIFSGIGITFMVGIALSLALWVFGPFLAFGETRPFESLVGLLVGFSVLWIGVLLVVLLILLTGRKRDDRMTDDIVTAADPGPAADEVVTAELGEMRQKLRSALSRLRRSKLGRRHLYELPWYIIIGPPGAGKTTAIVNSGLKFPLADDMGKTAIAGVGGTRNCDWWFTDNAVLVDTAGRYTTQESDAQADNAAWTGFLDMLKKHRKRQPINGAIIAISLSDLSNQDEFSQRAHAAAIRRRLHELRERLGVRFPVYVLFTKADLLAGFTEVFEGLPKDEREQVWGFTLPLPTSGTAAPVAGFDDEFSALLARINAQTLDRLNTETDPQRRSLIATFPQQLASVRPVARDFLTEVFQENRFEHRQLLRGVYFTSGTQEGTPIDRLMMGMARSFGIGRQAIGAGRGPGRSYFLTRLFDSVIFREAGLVSADDKVERRYRMMRVAAFVGAFAVAAALGTLWVRSYLGNRALVADVAQRIEAYRAAAAQIPPGAVGDSDVVQVLPSLDILRDIPGNPAGGAVVSAGALGWGLYQGGVIGNEAQQAYRAALNQHFLPRLLLRLEDQIQGNANNPEVLFDALKVYLMLGLVGPMNRDQVSDWLARDWAQSFDGVANEPVRAALEGHLAALLAQPMEAIALNEDLVTAARNILTQMPQAQRVYNSILASPVATSLPKFRLTDAAGPAVARVLVRTSGQPLNEGVDGIFTRKGFRDVFLNEALEVSARLQGDAFVLGPQDATAQSEAALLAISRDVLDLYYSDYVAKYDALLGDVDIVPMESLRHAVDVLNVLAGKTSPMAKLLEAVAAETRLTAVDEVPGAAQAAAAGGVLGKLGFAALNPRARLLLEAMARSAPPGRTGEVPGEFVERRFGWLHSLVARADGQPSQLDGMLDMLAELHQDMNKLSISGGVGNPQAEAGTAMVRFQQAASAVPGPLQRWSTQIASGSSGISADGTRAGINARWQANVLGFCEQATANAYPINRKGRADISMRDFATLFGPGGQIDTFFNENLSKFVDTRTRPWSSKVVNGTDLGLPTEVLQQFQHAAEIREAFFAGNPVPAVTFQITPVALAPEAQSMVLEIDGAQIAYKHGDPPRPSQVVWPGPAGFAQLTMLPATAASENALGRTGPWAWLRLLDAAAVRQTAASDRFRINFNVGGRTAIFEMQSVSVLNPFGLAALSKFRCPKSF
jgi:type VI secretion system protein ImpL